MDKAAHNFLQFDRFLLDLGRGCLRTAEQEIALRPKVFEVLRHLAENAGRLVPKQELYDAVWPNVVVSDDSLVQCIRELRRKLDDDAHQLIKTVSRRGYLLNVPTSTGETASPLLSQASTAGTSNGRNAFSSSLSDRPSIAVLPFDNLSGDAMASHVADGLVEDLIAALAKVHGLFVVDRYSTRIYRDRSVNVREIARALGVRYVLAGSIRTHRDRLRCSIQLVDSADGHHLWTERYDRLIEDIFALQDEIVLHILLELQVRLTDGDSARIASRGTRNLEAWLLRVQGAAEMLRFTQEETARARNLFEAAHRADPNWARPLAAIAFSHYQDVRFGWCAVREYSIAHGIAYAERAIAMDPEGSLGYQALGVLHRLLGHHDKAASFLKHAAALAPNDSFAVGMFAAQLTYMEQSEKAIEAFERADRLTPTAAHKPIQRSFGLALQITGQVDRAITVLEVLVRRDPEWPDGLAQLAAAYADAGRIKLAQATARKILTRDPAYTASRYLATIPFQRPARTEWLRDLLVKAGLPEGDEREPPS